MKLNNEETVIQQELEEIEIKYHNSRNKVEKIKGFLKEKPLFF